MVLVRCGRSIVLARTWRGADHHDQRDDQAVQDQHFGKDEDKNHADVETRLLRVSSHTCVADDTNGHACAHAGQADAEAGSQVEKAPEKQNDPSASRNDPTGSSGQARARCSYARRVYCWPIFPVMMTATTRP